MVWSLPALCPTELQGRNCCCVTPGAVDRFVLWGFFMFVCLFGLSLWNGLRADLTVPILTSNKTTTQTVGGSISGFELPIARPIMIPLPKEIWSGYIAVGLFWSGIRGGLNVSCPTGVRYLTCRYLTCRWRYVRTQVPFGNFSLGFGLWSNRLLHNGTVEYWTRSTSSPVRSLFTCVCVGMCVCVSVWVCVCECVCKQRRNERYLDYWFCINSFVNAYV